MIDRPRAWHPPYVRAFVILPIVVALGCGTRTSLAGGAEGDESGESESGESAEGESAGTDGPGPEGELCTPQWSFVDTPRSGYVGALTGLAGERPYLAVRDENEVGHVLRPIDQDWQSTWVAEAWPTDLLVLAHDDVYVTTIFSDEGGGTLEHYDGVEWVSVHVGSLKMHAVRRLQDGDLVAVGCEDAGCSTARVLLESYGWYPVEVEGADDMRAVWGTSAQDVYVAGWPGAVVHGTVGAWTVIQHGSGRHFELWTAPDGVFVGGSGGVFHVEDDVPTVVLDEASVVYGVWSDGPQSSLAGGCRAPDGACVEAALFQQVGTQLVPIAAPPGDSISAVWSEGDCTLWAATDAGVFHSPG